MLSAHCQRQSSSRQALRHVQCQLQRTSLARFVRQSLERLMHAPFSYHHRPWIESVCLAEAAEAYLLSTLVSCMRTPTTACVADEERACTVVEYLPDGRSVSYESSFGWHSVDLRTPLPPLSELAEHPVGVRGGKLVYLWTGKDAIKYGVVEASPAFSEHYSTRVYICQ